MDLNATEQMMFRVMKAVYDARLPLSFKGSMVLKAALLEAGYEDSVRHTVDIDGSWFSGGSPTVELIASSLQESLDKAGINYTVIAFRDYGDKQTAGFNFNPKKEGEPSFKMDMEINKPLRKQKLYVVAGCTFSGVAVSSILADKIFVVSSRKVFRRMKDVFDLYYLSKVVVIDKDEIMSILEASNQILGPFEEFLHMKVELCHAYDKFQMLDNAVKIPFDEPYDGVKNYIKDFLPVD